MSASEPINRSRYRWTTIAGFLDFWLKENPLTQPE